MPARRGRQIPMYIAVSHQGGRWELNSGPLGEQPALLTSEPSLQPAFDSFYTDPEACSLKQTNKKGAIG